MFDVVGPGYPYCGRIHRRQMLRVGALAAGGMTLAGLLRLKSMAGTRDTGAPKTAVIQIFMGGGPSHIDMYDLKPNAPAEIRGEFREIPTSVPGVRISEHLPLQAAVMDKLAIVRSVTHGNSSHLPGSHLILTGYETTVAAEGNRNPFSGAVVSRLRGANVEGLPAYVAVPKRVSFGGAAYLGATYNPFTTDMDPNADDFRVPNLTPARGISYERLGNRRSLLGEFDRMRRDLDLHGDLAGMDGYFRQAMELLTSRRAAEAFDMSREDSRTRDRYGRTPIGQNCLLARRLVEAGVTYVTCMSGGGWDTHRDNFSELKRVTLPRYDRAVAALVSDIHERGLADHVLVLAMGEFGRTPRINRDAGRDHWPGAMCVLLAGAGLKVGQMVGETDAHAALPVSKPYAPACVLATLYHKMGIDFRQVFHDESNRPMPILQDGHPIEELV